MNDIELGEAKVAYKAAQAAHHTAALVYSDALLTFEAARVARIAQATKDASAMESARVAYRVAMTVYSVAKSAAVDAVIAHKDANPNHAIYLR